MFGVLQRTGTRALYSPGVPGPEAGCLEMPWGQGPFAVSPFLLLDSSFSEGTTFGVTKGVQNLEILK